MIAHAEAATRPQGALVWPTRLGDHDIWRWWCHGAPGIALTFLKLFETTGVARYADIAAAAEGIAGAAAAMSVAPIAEAPAPTATRRDMG